jgi:hypothetical protein
MLGFVSERLLQGGSLTVMRPSFDALQSFIASGCMQVSARLSAMFSESSAVPTHPGRGFWVFLTDNFATVQDSDIESVQHTYPTLLSAVT